MTKIILELDFEMHSYLFDYSAVKGMAVVKTDKDATER